MSGQTKYKDETKKSKKRHRHDDDSSKKHKRKKKDKVEIVDEDDEDLWVEKNIDMDGERPLATDIPTSDSLNLTSHATQESKAPLPPSRPAETSLKRDDWMLDLTTSSSAQFGASSSPMIQLHAEDVPLTEEYGDESSGKRTLGGGVDFFSSLGTEHKRKPPPKEKHNPDQPAPVSSRELNPDLRPSGGPASSEPAISSPSASKSTPGGPGSSWRMMRLRKVYETAEEENLPLDQVAIDRFGSLEAFEDAKEERRILDEREGKKTSKGGPRSSMGAGGEKGFMFNDLTGSGASSRSSSFRRPGAASGGFNTVSRPSTPVPSGSQPANKRLDSLRLPSQASSPLAQNPTHIPTVMTPPAATSKRALSPSSLNRLQAKVLRAKLMGTPDTAELEKQYQEEERKANGYIVTEEPTGQGKGKEVRTKIEVLPTLDGQGRLYDVGHGKDDADTDAASRKRRKKEEKKFETRDSETGDLVRYSKDDDELTLGEMLRQEKMKGGMADQKNLDAEYARAIATDGKYTNDLDYIDDNAEKLSRKKMRTDAMKRQFAIHDYKRTQQALATCPFCFAEDDSPPKAPVVAMGTRVYLSCTLNEELVDGHCLIVPIQHHLCLLEGDDDVWDEVKNFMKCLMRMYAEKDQGVLFYETVISHKQQKHSFIECVPLPWDNFEVMPGYFKESILTSESEWSQHKKLIDFSQRPFRRAMVPNLPYFMVQFDYKGEKGFGHVIEGSAKADEAEEEWGLGDMDGGKGSFPPWFAGEIIGNVLDLEPRAWRRPRKIGFERNRERVKRFRTGYDKYDWTGLIGRS